MGLLWFADVYSDKAWLTCVCITGMNARMVILRVVKLFFGGQFGHVCHCDFFSDNTVFDISAANGLFFRSLCFAVFALMYCKAGVR